MSDDPISRKALAEEIESLRISITGLGVKKEDTLKLLREYKKSVLKCIEEAPEMYDVKKSEEKEINNAQELTTEEIKQMSHCIGLDHKNPYKRHGRKFYKPYRNYYTTCVWNYIWSTLLWKGFAKHGKVGRIQDTVFWLTREGLDALGDAIGVHIYDEEK